jgi:glycosyltransferase involved in cell wall biosynthesis
VIPIKGRSELFALTAQSLGGQTYPDWEAIVVDDGSAASEFTHIAEIARTDARIRLLRNPGPRPGACACRNAGFAASTGQYVVFLDSDDTLATTCLGRRVEVMECNPALDFAAFPMWIFHHQPGDSPFLWNTFTDEDDLDRFLRGDSPWNTASAIWRRASLARTGLWDEHALSMQDWEFHVRALTLKMNYLKVPEPDSFWRAPTPCGSIGSSAHSPRYIVNRVRLLIKAADGLRTQNLLTAQRRKLLATQFFRHAFRLQLRRGWARLIWRIGQRERIVSPFEFYVILLCEFAITMAGRLSRGCEQWVYPDLRRSPQYGVHKFIGPNEAASALFSLPPLSSHD